MKIYVVNLWFFDSDEWEPMNWDTIMALFTTKESAIKFCEENSDDEEYRILTEREIPNLALDDDDVIDISSFDLERGLFNLSINELNVLE